MKSTAVRATLKRAISALEKTEWTADALDAAIRALADDKKVKLAAVAQPLRAALTGRTTSPPSRVTGPRKLITKSLAGAS